MTQQTNIAPATRWFRRPLTPIAISMAVFLIVFLMLAGPSWPAVIYQLLVDGAAIGLWLLGATGIGWTILPLFLSRDRKIADPLLSLITAASVGLGIVSLVVLALGLAGYLNRVSALTMLSVGMLLSLFAALRNRSFKFSLSAKASWHWLLIPLAPLIAMTILADLFPPGLLWGDEPNGYDVVEYHLQIPREWYEAGKIIPLHHNVFSYMPLNVEMHYLLAMQLHGGQWGPWAGMYLAQLMHATMFGLALLAIYALAGKGKRGALAAMIAAAVPWTPLLAAVAYNEGGMVLWGTLAIGWAMRAGNARQFALAGIFAGLAAGAKLTAIPLLFLGVPISVLISAVFRKQPIQLKGLIFYVVCAFIALSPWLARNAIWTGNPIFPEAMKLLGKAHFSDVQVERWRQAYLPDKDHRTIVGRLTALAEQVIIDPRYGYLLVPLGIAAAILSRAKGETVFLILLVIIQTFVWLFFTHLQSRFMVVIIPLFALIIAQYDHSIWRWIVAISAIAMLAFSASLIASKLSRYIQADRKVGLIARENLGGLRPLDTDQIPNDASVNLVGDAYVFWYQIPMTRLHYKTVFDVDTSDRNKSIEEDWLAGMPQASVIYRDPEELNRFARTYYAIPKSSLPAK